MKIPSIKDLQEKLQDLREHLLTTRPSLPPETRPFTYQKATVNSHGDTTGWEYVTDHVTVHLRKFGVPECEERCIELGKEIREVKDQVKELGYQPIEHGENYATWRSKNPER